MALCEIHWSSRVLGKCVGTHIILPEQGEPPFPVFYLLHGLSDDYTMWHRRSRIEWYVRDLPLIVVMPDGYRGFYTNNENGPAYATYMAEELTAMVERNFPARSERAARCIGGLSMGGYGALRLALGYPETYLSANSHSGALGFGHKPVDDADPRAEEFRRILGDDPTGSEHDLFALATRCHQRNTLPFLRVDCGVDDFLIDHNRAFRHHLEALDIPHEYEEFPGAHTWDYWDLHIREALEFHCRHLGIAAESDAAG